MAVVPVRHTPVWRIERVVRSLLFYGAIIIFLIIILLPLYYVFLTAFAPSDQLFTQPLTYLPRAFNFGRYTQIFAALPLWRYLWNTFFLSTVSTLIALLICFLAAYAIARFRFPGANLVLIVLLASSMLPGAATVIPLFQMYQTLKLMNTLQGLLLLYVSAMIPFTTWVLVSFVRQLPVEVEEAAQVDGAGFVRLLWYIVLPMIRPGLATMFLINFITGWNEFFTPLIFARGPASKVISMALTEAQVIGSSSQFQQNWGNMSAVAILATIPVFIITLSFQHQIVEGLTNGAVK